MTKISAVPTNIITGFLGAGKTSLILYLLKHKPEHERWAVLVNEFGEVGVDGSLFVGLAGGRDVFIREVPGGCMCCAAGLPMHIALNQLLARAKPDRLLIEPTGLGHPKEILQVLNAEHYQEVLSVGPTLTLVDARNLADERYTTHDTFNQQIDIADCIVGSKSDTYGESDRHLLMDYIHERKDNCPVVFSVNGAIDLALLSSKDAKPIKPKPFSVVTDNSHLGNRLAPSYIDQTVKDNDTPIPECGYIKKVNLGEGYASVGWRFAASKVFDRQGLISWFQQLQAERIKAVVITADGVFGYNYAGDELIETELDDCLESLIEIIVLQSDDGTDFDREPQLLQCLVGN